MQTIEIIRGDDVTLSITLTDVNGTALNITDGTVFFTIKQNITDTDTDALLKTSVTSHTNGAAGLTSIPLTATQTDITPGVYYYDLQVKDAQNRIQSTEIGKIIVSQDATTRTI
jgi:hypothetical protein